MHRTLARYLIGMDHGYGYSFLREPWAAFKFSSELILLLVTDDHPGSLFQNLPHPSSVPLQIYASP